MAVHLKKLCVGVKSLEQLSNWQNTKSFTHESGVEVVRHITRNFPKRVDELLSGGSLYWVIKGNILARNEIVAFEELVDSDGKKQCVILLKTPFTATEPQPHRPFQGWRYYKQDSIPRDVKYGSNPQNLPTEMMLELKELGLL